MYDTLIVPTDGSEHAERAAEHALTMARAFDATVHFINAVDVQEAGGLFSAGGVDEEFVARLEDRARDLLDDLEALAEPGDDVRTAVVRNSPSKGVLAYADEHDADLVFMGTHGRTGVNRYVTGSVTERVVRLSDVPVFTVRATGRSVVDGYDDVVIPTDGSDCAELAVDHGLAIAEQFDATVHAVYVVDVRTVATPADDPVETELLSRLEELGREAAEAIAERAREAGLDATASVAEGAPASGLVDYVEEEDVDLVAMGTHGRTGFDRYFLGSTAAKVVRTSEVPVLSVRAADRDE